MLTAFFAFTTASFFVAMLANVATEVASTRAFS